MLSTAWTIGSIDFGSGEIRTGFTVLALVTDDELSRLVREIGKELQKIEGEALRKDFLAIVQHSEEEMAEALAAAPGGFRVYPAPQAPRRLRIWTNSPSI